MSKKDLQIKQLQEQAEFQSRMLVKANQRISDLIEQMDQDRSELETHREKLRQMVILLKNERYSLEDE